MVSTGHSALDHRIFDKEAMTLARSGFAVRVIAAHACRERRDGIELVPLDQGATRLGRFVVAPWRAFRAARRHPAPIVHIHDLELLLICPLLKLLRQPVIVYEVHEDFPNLMRRRDWIPRTLRPLVGVATAVAEAALAHSADAVVGPTRTLVDRFPRHRRLALYNLPSRSFLERAVGGAPPSRRPFDVVHLGVLSRERMEFLAEVLAELRMQRPHARFRIVGVTDAQSAWLRAQLSTENTEVLGKVGYANVAALLRDCKMGVNVHPILHPHIRLAVPVKVFEYMACGCGVVTSSLPELDRLLDDATRRSMTVVRGHDPRTYADALAGWLNDPVRLDSAGASLQQAIRERYLWESRADRLAALYHELLEPSAARERKDAR